MSTSSFAPKWNVKSLEILDRVPTYYSIGHLMVPGGNTRKPFGKYVVAYNKITKDRYLPTGPELTQSAQIYNIEGDKMLHTSHSRQLCFKNTLFTTTTSLSSGHLLPQYTTTSHNQGSAYAIG